ncbi:MAG: LysR family transcriptional regulator [Rhodospirillales bacterium]|nr:MAG: LysR family transcriptional regulator [Rhodospirillales bacterium]
MASTSLRQIRYFVAVFEEGGFSRAAARENCAQPALSVQIRNLEENLGQTLFERSAGGVTPTAAGRRFYGHAVSILRAVRGAELDIAEMRGQVSGAVRAGLIPSAVRGLLPAMLPTFLDAHPRIELRIMQAYSGTLIEWLHAGKLDFALVIEPAVQDGLEIVRFSEERMVLISGRALGLKPWRPVRLAALPPLRLVVPTMRHGLRRNIERSIKTSNVTLERIFEMDAMEGTFEFIKRTDWATILPLTAVLNDLDSEQLCLNPIAEPAIKSDFYLVHLTQRPFSAATQSFVDALKAAARANTDAWDSTVLRHADPARPG